MAGLFLSPDEIVSQYPSLTLADVYATLADYHDYSEQIRQQIREDEDFAKQLHLTTPSILQQKLQMVRYGLL
ncbi:MAG: DUF433 domain-containing protein [Heteroscytonema crispum UTEX LB 1556]